MFRNTWYWCAVWICRAYARLCCKIDVRGTEHIPQQGALLLTANHISHFDPFLIAGGVKRCVHFIAMEELFASRLTAFFMRRWKTIPVKRNSPDKRTITEALRVLHSGSIVGVFPEGGIVKTGIDKAYQTGVAMLAMKADVPVLPVRIEGSRALYRPNPFARKTITIEYKPLCLIPEMIRNVNNGSKNMDKKILRNHIIKQIEEHITSNV